MRIAQRLKPCLTKSGSVLNHLAIASRSRHVSAARPHVSVPNFAGRGYLGVRRLAAAFASRSLLRRSLRSATRLCPASSTASRSAYPQIRTLPEKRILPRWSEFGMTRDPIYGTRGKPRARQGGGKPPHSQGAWRHRDGSTRGQRRVKGAQPKSPCSNSEVFVGRGFSHDVSAARSARLQPLKHIFCLCHTDSKARRYKRSPLRSLFLGLQEFRDFAGRGHRGLGAVAGYGDCGYRGGVASGFERVLA